MIKMIYVSIFVLNVLMTIELNMMATRTIKELGLTRIREKTLIEKIIGLIKSFLMDITPILNLIVFVSLLTVSCSETARDAYLDKVLENYE